MEIRFPVEVKAPAGFDPADLSTWPKTSGRLEFVEGRLLYMPPCGDNQMESAVDVVYVLKRWSKKHPGFSVGGNEAGIHLGGESRGAEAAVWRRATLPPNTGGFRRVPPVLAVEVAGVDEDETDLRLKARWYLRNRVAWVWIVLPRTREVVVLGPDFDRRYAWTGRLPGVPELPGLKPRVADLMEQLGPPSRKPRRH